MSTFRSIAVLAALHGGCDVRAAFPEACVAQPVPADEADRAAAEAELDVALPGGTLEVPASWSDATSTTLTVSSDVDLGAASRLERPCSGEVTGWSAPADLTVRTADGRLDGQVRVEVLGGSFAPVTFVVPAGLVAPTLLDELGVPDAAEIDTTRLRLFDGAEPSGELSVHWTRHEGSTDIGSRTRLLSW